MILSRSRLSRHLLAPLTCAVLAAAFPLAAAAQDTKDTQNTGISYPTGLNTCFDYYKFGTLPTSLTVAHEDTPQGTDALFTGTVTNQNPYPIVDATVYIKVFRLRGAEKDLNGPDVVDWLPIKEHFTIHPGEVLPLSFSWNVPKDAWPGAYQIATYVVSSDRFEYQGLTFTDDVVGALTDFKVTGDDSGAVHFDKAGVTVGNRPFYFAAFPPTVSGTDEITVNAKVVNSTATAYDGSVTWTLYYWDSINATHRLDGATQSIHVGPLDTAPVSFRVSDTAHSVYYLVGELSSSDGSKSIVGVRFVRAGIQEPRLNSIGVMEYPLHAGSSAYACFHSTGTALAPDVRVELSARKAGVLGLFGPFASIAYEGSAPGELSALPLPVDSPSASFTLTASLYQHGALVDAVSLPYDCAALGGTCSFFETQASLWALGALVALVVIIIAVVILVRTRRKNRTMPQPVPPTTTI